MADKKAFGRSTASFSAGMSVSAGKLVFISGTVAMDEQGQIIGTGSMELQSRAIFKKIEALLGEAGASLQDVVKITTFVTDIRRYDEFARVRKDVFGSPYPASATVEVKGLIKDGLLIEVEALAVL